LTIGATAANPGYLFSAIWALIAVFVSVCTPRDYTAMLAAKTERDQAEDFVEGIQTNDVAVEKLAEETRRGIWLEALIYNIERALIVAALEAATSVVLEKEFMWSSSATGIAVGCSFIGSVPLALFVEFLRRSSIIPLQSLLVACAFICSTSTVLLFPQACPVALRKTNIAALFVLFADAIIFSTGYIASGIVDGVGIRSSIAGTWRSEENYLVYSPTFQFIFSRGLGPLMGQALVVWHGRAMYATVQLVISLLGFKMCWSIAQAMQSQAAATPRK